MIGALIGWPGLRLPGSRGAIPFWTGWNIVRGRWGLAMMAVRDQLAAMGVGAARTTVTAFAVGAGYAGAAGALQDLLVGNVSPEQLSLAASFSLVSGIVIGGLGPSPARWSARCS